MADNGILRFRKVALGLQDGARAAVTKGLKAGTWSQSTPPVLSRYQDQSENPSRPPEGLMDLAFHDIRQHLGRFLATLIGVGLLFALVLAFNGIYRGFLLEGLSFIKTTNPDLWVVERNRGGPINEQSILPEFYHYSVAAIAGVARPAPSSIFPWKGKSWGKTGASPSSATMSSGVREGPRISWPATASTGLIMKWWPIKN